MYPQHPQQLLRLAQDRIDAAHSEAARARLVPPLRYRLAAALRTLAARLEPDMTLEDAVLEAHQSALNHI